MILQIDRSCNQVQVTGDGVQVVILDETFESMSGLDILTAIHREKSRVKEILSNG